MRSGAERKPQLQAPQQQQPQREFRRDPASAYAELLVEGKTRICPPWFTPLTVSSFSFSLSKIKTLDKAGVLHRTKTVDKGKRLR